MTITFYCPVHYVEETVQLPESYSPEFQGDIPCGIGNEDWKPIHIELINGRVVKIAAG